MLHLMLVFAVGDVIRAKLIRCHRAGLISCSHICMYGQALAWAIVVPFTGSTKEGRLRIARYHVSDMFTRESLIGTMLWTMRWSGPCNGRCLEDTGIPKACDVGGT